MYIQNVHELHKLVSQIIKQRWLQVCNDRTYYTKLLLNFDFSRIYHSIQSKNMVEKWANTENDSSLPYAIDLKIKV